MFWTTRKQLLFVASSTEAEYLALFEAVWETLWLKALSVNIKIDIPEPIKIYKEKNIYKIPLFKRTSWEKLNKINLYSNRSLISWHTHTIIACS